VSSTDAARAGRIDAVVFDLGGVLIEWDPRLLYRRLFEGDEQAVEHFLATVCTPAWNDELDRGLPFAEGVARLTVEHPDEAALIEAYQTRWDEMLGPPIAGSVDALAEVKRRGTPVYALSNWSLDTYPVAARRFDFLEWFDGVLLSGEIGVTKPDPRIFAALCDRFGLVAGRTLFVDDRPENVAGAERAGLRALLFTDAPRLRAGLVDAGVLA
jgi:2-haloacid dehalogenase